MKIFGMGMPELLIILVVVLIIFGPKQLPKLGATLGKTVKSIREGMDSDKETEVTKEEIVEAEEVEKPVRKKKPAAAAKTSEAEETEEE